MLVPAVIPLGVDTSCSHTTPVFDHICSVPDLDNNSGALIQHLVEAVLIFGAVILVGRVGRSVTLRAMDRAEADPQLRTLVNNVVLAVTIVVAILGALATAIGLNVVLTFGGIATVAIGLAFQDLLRNVLAGIFLLIERPFRIGDVITLDDVTGVVQTIELRTTTMRLADGRLAVMPNLNAFTKTLVNSTAYDRRQFTVSLWVPPGVDLEEVIRAARSVLDTTGEVLGHPPASLQPRLDPDGGVTLDAHYWLEYRQHDPDTVAADITRRLYAATRALLTGAATT